jgi:hypothetical protein
VFTEKKKILQMANIKDRVVPTTHLVSMAMIDFSMPFVLLSELRVVLLK